MNQLLSTVNGQMLSWAIMSYEKSAILTHTKPNAVTVHAVFESAMTGDDGTEVQHRLPADSKTVLFQHLLRSFTLQPARITFVMTQCKDNHTGRPQQGYQKIPGPIHPVTRRLGFQVLRGRYTTHFRLLGC